MDYNEVDYDLLVDYSYNYPDDYHSHRMMTPVQVIEVKRVFERPGDMRTGQDYKTSSYSYSSQCCDTVLDGELLLLILTGIGAGTIFFRNQIIANIMGRKKRSVLKGIKNAVY